MAGIKISELLEVLTANDDDLLVIETDTGTKKITKENLLAGIDIDNVVHKTGDETISGYKTFTNGIGAVGISVDDLSVNSQAITIGDPTGEEGSIVITPDSIEGWYREDPEDPTTDVGYTLNFPSGVGTLATQDYVDAIVGDIETLLEAI